MKIIQTFTTLAVLAVAFSAAEGRVLRGAAAAAEVGEDMAGVVGRPLTPVSVAGSARRVSRRTARRNSRSLAEGDAIEKRTEENFYHFRLFGAFWVAAIWTARKESCRAAECMLKRTAPRDGALPVIITFTSNHKATLQTTT